MRPIAGFMGLLLLLEVGCTRQCFMQEGDFYQAQHVPLKLETDPYAAVQPIIPAIAAPANVDSPERPPRFLTLQEAIAVALEYGYSPRQFRLQQEGFFEPNLAESQGGFGGGASFSNQAGGIRVLALKPAIEFANMEASLSRFDAEWVTAMNWTNTDNLQQGLTSFQNGSRATFTTSIVKAFASGGVANISFLTDYQLLNSPPTAQFAVINPLYTTRLQLGFEQPLWRDFGVDINQLLNRIPGITGVTMPAGVANAFNAKQAVLNQVPAFGGVGTEGILISRLRFDASRAQFEVSIAALLLNVEAAYWNLYQAYGQLYSFEEVLRLAHRSWMDNLKKLEAGNLNPFEFYPIRGQYEEFRGERTKALGAVLEAERHLRGLLGLHVEDGLRLVPITPPTLAPYCPDWGASLRDCMTHRPELILARDNLRASQFNVISHYNFLKPDLRFVGSITPLGFGTRLDGNGTFVDGTGTERTNNALRSLAGTHFNDYTLGLTLSVPLGFRLENAALRAAKIELARSYLLLKEQEEKATHALSISYQKISEWYRRIQATRAERQAYGEAVDARYKAFKAGKGSVDGLLESQRRLALAQVKEYEAITQYNISLVRLEWAKGTVLHHDNIVIAEGALPSCAQVRAVEHERERSKALVVCTRPEPLRQPGMLAAEAHELPKELDVNMPVDPSGVAKSGGDSQAKPPVLSMPPSTAERIYIIPNPMMDPNSEDSPWRKSAKPGLPPASEMRPPSERNTAPGPLAWPGMEEFRPAPVPPALPPSTGPATTSGVQPAGFRSREPRSISDPPQFLPDGARFLPAALPLNEPVGIPAALPPALR